MMCRLSEVGYRAIAPDLPGYGNSNGFTLRDYALENQTTLLHELMEKLGIKSFDLAGNSMGGAIAQLYAQSYPNLYFQQQLDEIFLLKFLLCQL